MCFTLYKTFQKRRILTVIFVGLVLLAIQVSADLAPNEDDDDDDKVALDQKPSIDQGTNDESTTQGPKVNVGFLHAFIASFSVIIVSEIGDKTFFIACIMAMKYPRLVVFGGAITALALMTILSAVFGMVFIQFIPPAITRWISVGLFVVFGLKMLHEGWNMTATDAVEEMEEVQADIRKREDELMLRTFDKRTEPDILVDPEATNSNNNRLTNGIHADKSMVIRELNKIFLRLNVLSLTMQTIIKTSSFFSLFINIFLLKLFFLKN